MTAAPLLLLRLAAVTWPPTRPLAEALPPTARPHTPPGGGSPHTQTRPLAEAACQPTVSCAGKPGGRGQRT